MMKIINKNKGNKGDSDYYYFCAMIKKVAVPFLKKVAVPFLVVCFFVATAQAEVSVIKSSLTWGPDKSGEYLLPELSNGMYATDRFVAAKGQVSAITMNWKSRGKIEMEVSLDNGLHYTPVVNGVPLKSGFVKGDRIRWRAKALSDDAKLISVKISYVDTSGVRGDFGEPLLSGYQYRKVFTIKNNSTQDLYNYQLRLRIGEGELTKDAELNTSSRAKEDFSDLRFTAADAQTILPYYLERIEGEEPNRVAVVWVNVPQLLKGSLLNLYLYYGNSQAASLSDGDKTFDFFDDFNDPVKSNEKWVTYAEKSGALQLKDGKIKLDAAEAITKDFIFKKGIIEYFAQIESGFENSLNLRAKNDNSYDIPAWVAYSSAHKGAEHCIAIDGIVKSNDLSAIPLSLGEAYLYRLESLGGNISFSRYEAKAKEKQAEAVYEHLPEQKEGYISLRSGGDGSGKNVVYFSQIRVRKSALVEPSFVSSGNEELVSLPVFSNTIISPKGNLVLADEAKSGYYISMGVSSLEPIRIIIPDWRIDSFDKTYLNFKISADRGQTFKGDCKKNNFYYLSRKDFNGGDNLKARVDLSRDTLAQVSSGLSAISLDYRPGRINVIAPNGGEDIPYGSQRDITWSAQEYEENYPMNIYFSSDSGKNYQLIAGGVFNSGDYLWNVEAAETKRGMVKISDALDASVFDTSDKVFKVVKRAESSEYILSGEGKWDNANAWANHRIPGILSDVKVSSNTTLIAENPVAFRSLTIGDGIGNVTTKLILKAGVELGSGEIIIRKGGQLIQDGKPQVVINGNLTVKSGGLITHTASGKVDISAKNITLEPGSIVGASAKYGKDGGVVKLTTPGNFNISGRINADGDKIAGGKGGEIYLTAGSFSGEKAVITADGGYNESNPDNHGKFIPKGLGRISGLVSTSSGER
ncbi:MAG: DUF2341 domain-containing protein [Candidatus Omnitrophota bacterium]